MTGTLIDLVTLPKAYETLIVAEPAAIPIICPPEVTVAIFSLLLVKVRLLVTTTRPPLAVEFSLPALL